MKFTKMHGLGNDYLYVYGEVPADIKTLCVKLSDRHIGAGSDGMIYISSSEIADYKMRIFNADGSEAMMCGNGIRCVGKYVFEKGYTDKTQLDIETLSGIKKLDLYVEEGIVNSVTVDMGCAEVGDAMELQLPEHMTISNAFTGKLPENGARLQHEKPVSCIPVSVGNPHAVFFVENAETVPLEKVGPFIEHHPFFPDGVNAEFIQLTGKNEIRMRVWERGSGITMACGTGACASVAATVKSGICDYDVPIAVHLDGGILKITVSRDGNVKMEGSSEFVYDAETCGI